MSTAPDRKPRGPRPDARAGTALLCVGDTLVAVTSGLLFAAPLLVYSWLRLPERDPAVERAPQVVASIGTPLLFGLLIGTLAFGITGWRLRRRRPVHDWRRPEPLRLSPAHAVPIGILTGLGGLFLSGVVGALTLGLLGLEPPDQELNEAITSSGGVVLALFAFTAVVAAPIAEELFFRGHLFRWSASRHGTTYGYVLTSLIFAAAHLSLVAMPIYFVDGLILAWSYQRWRSLLVPIVAHATFNGLVVAAMVSRAST